ncbi:MAG TPA: sigma-70 family RNA polymerase sigma factor [Cytophagaceae bacterium]|jgi:RNA polymerase sigma factor (sigma-70 family)|nr:sigma-70 family RNA polymerase sigma factor [Cytophagaceae bacterium]
MSRNYTDKEIVEGIRRDDKGVLEFLYKENFHAVAFFIYNNSGSEQDAKDICQEAVIILYEKLKGDALELNCSVKTYLYSVCRRLWLKKLYYKSKFTGKLDDFENIFSTEEQSEAEEKERDFTRMEVSLNGLGEPCRTILEDYYVNKLSMADICEKFGYTNADNAKNQKYKCLMRLKKIFFSAS